MGLAMTVIAAGVVLWPAIGKALPKARLEADRGLATLPRDLQIPSSRPPSTPASLPPGTSAPSPPTLAADWTAPSTSDCQWGTATLALDRTLDLQAVGSYPQSASWYQKTAGWWQKAGIDLAGLCGTAQLTTESACEADLAHFAEARQIHLAAVVTDTTSADRLWDQFWADNYQRLERIWLGARCGSRRG